MSKAKSKRDYDLLILGSGAGGGVAAHIAANKGKRVAIVEPEEIGGECPNWGCVPTKALLHAAHIYEEAKNSKQYGLKIPTVDVNYPKVKAWKDLAVHRTGTYKGEEIYQSSGVDIIKGRGRFINPHEVSVDGKRYSASKFLIATGTSNFIPPIEGLDKVEYITYREAINLTKPPKSLFVIGGGAIGCEFANLFAIFGTKVHIAEFSDHLLPKEDEENGKLLEAIFKKKYGINVLSGTKVIKVENIKGKKKIHFKKGYNTETVTVDTLLMATGKSANVDIGLENAGVEYTPKNVITNNLMQTSSKHIYAAGDVAGPYMFTHMASYQSKIAANNMFHREKIKTDYRAVPRCVFVNPEIASVGLSENEIKSSKIRYKKAIARISVIGRANTEDKLEGFVKVISNEKGVILGASIAAPRAGEMIHELTVAVHNRMTVNQIASTIHAFPTWSEAVRIACNKLI